MSKKLVIALIVLLVVIVSLDVFFILFSGVKSKITTMTVYNMSSETLKDIKEKKQDFTYITKHTFSANTNDYRFINVNIKVSNNTFDRLNTVDLKLIDPSNNFALTLTGSPWGISLGRMGSNDLYWPITINSKGLSEDQIKQKLKTLEFIVTAEGKDITKLKISENTKIDFVNK